MIASNHITHAIKLIKDKITGNLNGEEKLSVVLEKNSLIFDHVSASNKESNE
jgi:hypothetical protein